MSRPWKIWVSLGICLVVLFAAMGWVSLTALRLEHAQDFSRRQAEFEEKVRLALWRMDSMLAPLIVQESSRPYFAYSSFFPAARAYGNMYNTDLRPGEALLPSPLLTEVSTNVLLHFQFGPDGALTSPQVPTGNKVDMAAANAVGREQIAEASERLNQLRALIDPRVLETLCSTNALRNFAVSPSIQVAQVPKGINAPAQLSAPQQEFNRMELQARAQNYQQAMVMNAQPQLPYRTQADLAEGVFKPAWFGESLVLARRVSVDGRRYLQGCWLNWPIIRKSLLVTVADLLPGAALEPLHGTMPEDPQGRMLASIPVHLLPGPMPLAAPTWFSPMHYALMLSWACVLVAALAVGVLLHGAVTLSERRAAFVSAVTHELRTPLTTFKMYSEMLAQGMVRDPEKEKQYLSTLCAEADRLTHLVENVLAYARLERGSARQRVGKILIRDLISTVRPRLEQRSTQAGMALQLDSDDRAQNAAVHVDVGAVEQILFNLVDNACKYAAPHADEKIIHLEAFTQGESVMLRVRDHGRGISAHDAHQLFRPFSKSAAQAAQSAPGIGLGLALCRRLSRSMGGDLRLDPLIKDGAGFVLRLPFAQAGALNATSASIT